MPGARPDCARESRRAARVFIHAETSGARLMCGIAGVLAFEHGAPVDESLVTRMRESVRHPGPDGACTWVANDGRIGLGHRRLSIIDLAPSAGQPMFHDDRSVAIVFNGEIYNQAAIRTELSDARWCTDHSDTEAILHAFERWGIECLSRLRGMFAFALWDARSRELWLVRDRVGVKPLYYAVYDGRIAFASEIKALLEDPALPRRVHEEALFHYLSFLTTPGSQTLFDGVRKLQPGTWLRARADGTIAEQRYWDAFDDVHPLDVPDDEASERILETLRDAVRLRKVSDVPVGVFLSGGLDSSTNAALFTEGEQTPVRTFSI